MSLTTQSGRKIDVTVNEKSVLARSYIAHAATGNHAIRPGMRISPSRLRSTLRRTLAPSIRCESSVFSQGHGRRPGADLSSTTVAAQGGECPAKMRGDRPGDWPELDRGRTVRDPRTVRPVVRLPCRA